jgi:hypothetical protein
MIGIIGAVTYLLKIDSWINAAIGFASSFLLLRLINFFINSACAVKGKAS